jgi:hypothetical protein
LGPVSPAGEKFADATARVMKEQGPGGNLPLQIRVDSKSPKVSPGAAASQRNLLDALSTAGRKTNGDLERLRSAESEKESQEPRNQAEVALVVPPASSRSPQSARQTDVERERQRDSKAIGIQLSALCTEIGTEKSVGAAVRTVGLSVPTTKKGQEHLEQFRLDVRRHLEKIAQSTPRQGKAPPLATLLHNLESVLQTDLRNAWHVQEILNIARQIGGEGASIVSRVIGQPADELEPLHDLLRRAGSNAKALDELQLVQLRRILGNLGFTLAAQDVGQVLSPRMKSRENKVAAELIRTATLTRQEVAEAATMTTPPRKDSEPLPPPTELPPQDLPPLENVAQSAEPSGALPSSTILPPPSHRPEDEFPPPPAGRPVDAGPPA